MWSQIHRFMNYDLMAQKYKGTIMEFSILVALATLAVQGKKEDDISENEARKTYGRQWLKDRTNRGMLKYIRTGATERSAKIYSRFEIEALKLAEKGVLSYVEQGRKEVEREQERLAEFMDRFNP